MKNKRYYVDSPWTDAGNGKFYPLTSVEFEKVKEIVVTKTGKKAVGAIVCVVNFWTGKRLVGQSVCHPIDEFVFWRGAKYALERALNTPAYREVGKRGDQHKGEMTKQMRTNIWAGFFMLFPKARE